MFLFVQYEPGNPDAKPSNAKLVVGTSIEGMPGKMLKVNDFSGEQADLMYAMLVGADEHGNVTNIDDLEGE